MNERFYRASSAAAVKFSTLKSLPILKDHDYKSLRKAAGVYVMYEGEIAVYVGRTRDLSGRIRGHRSSSHYAATFALRRAKLDWLELNPLVKRQSTLKLMTETSFKNIFLNHVTNIKNADVRFIACEEVLEQYLLEAYAIVSLGLDTNELNTH